MEEALSAPKQSKLEQIAKGAIFAIVFLIPIFFLPWTANVLDFNKQLILTVLVFVSLFAWLLRSLITSNFDFNQTLFNIPVASFLFISIFSVIFSMWRYGSFWGWPLDTGASLLTLISLVLFYFLVVNLFRTKENIFFLMLTLVCGGFLSAVYGILQIFGKFIIPLDFAKSTSFNTVGTINSLGIFLAALLPVLVSLIFVLKGKLKYVLGFMGIIMFFGVVLINYSVVWTVLLVGMAGVLVFAITRARQIDNRWLILPMAILTIALLFAVFKIPLSGLPGKNIEVSPSAKGTLGISTEVLKDRPLFGSGMGTFIYDFSKNRTKDLNQTLFWNVRFSKGSSEIMESLATTGILGALALLIVIGFFIYLGFRYLGPKATTGVDFGWTLALGVFGSFLSVVTAKFLYSSNLTIEFLFWVLAASFISLSSDKIKSWKLEPSSPVTVGLSFAFVLVLIFGVGLFYLEGQRYVNEVRYANGVLAMNNGNVDKSIENIAKAAITNSGQDNYWKDLSQVYLTKITEVLNSTTLTKDEKSSQISTLVGNAVNAAKYATDANPNNVQNWLNRGDVLRNLIGTVGGVDEFAITSFQEAQKLEPQNPAISFELGRVYLARADLLAQQTGKEKEKEADWASAKESFNKAIELKSDYAPAHFQIAMISVREGKTEEAISKLETTKLVAAARDTGLAFQLGLLYYNTNQYDKAKTEFSNVVSWNENYSNARYFLGLIADKQGNKTEALNQFEKIAKLNPDNTEITKIITNLKAGKAALYGISTENTEVPVK